MVELGVIEAASLLDGVVGEEGVENETALVVKVDPGVEPPEGPLDGPVLAASLAVKEATNDDKVVSEVSEDNPMAEARLERASDS